MSDIKVNLIPERTEISMEFLKGELVVDVSKGKVERCYVQALDGEIEHDVDWTALKIMVEKVSSIEHEKGASIIESGADHVI